jgi:DNA-directed RNA polymerase specialized sigma24 family protein
MDEQIEQLVIEAQQQARQTPERQLALEELVQQILRSRKIARPPMGEPLSGVYQEIYEQIKQQLLPEIDRELHNYNRKPISVTEWAKTLLHQASKKALEDEQLLKNLALEAQRHPPGSRLRQHALTQLIEAIRISGRLCHPKRPGLSPNFYNLLYDEAVNKTLIYVCRKIDKYDPERGVKRFMNWVNFRLERVFIECDRECRNQDIDVLPWPEEGYEIAAPEEPTSLFERVRECLEEDAGEIFQREFIKPRKDANFRAIALKRFEGKSWKEIAQELDLKIPTLSSFFQRSCEKFRSELKQCILE